MPRGVNYKARVSQPDVSGGWKTVVVSLPQFTNDSGASPAKWSTVDRLLFSGVTRTEPPLFSNFRWQSRKAE
jgi:hypothetical protein